MQREPRLRPINVRYTRSARDSAEALRQLPMLTERSAQLRLGNVAWAVPSRDTKPPSGNQGD